MDNPNPNPELSFENPPKSREWLPHNNSRSFRYPWRLKPQYPKFISGLMSPCLRLVFLLTSEPAAPCPSNMSNLAGDGSSNPYS